MAHAARSSTTLCGTTSQTVAFAGLVLFAGYGIRRGVPVLARYNIPAPVIGGLLVAGVLSFAASRGVTLVTFDTTLQAPLMIAFFTSVGFGASVALLRVGGPLAERRNFGARRVASRRVWGAQPHR